MAPTWQLTAVCNPKVMGSDSLSGLLDCCVNTQASRKQKRMARVGEGKPRPLFEGIEVYIGMVERL